MRVEKGVLLGLTAYAFWAFADALIKQLGKSLGVFEVGLALTTIGAVTAVALKPRDENLQDAFKLRHPWFVHAIALLRVSSGVSLTYAFMTLPLAEAYSLGFLIPTMCTIFSVIFLREGVQVERWFFIALSFAGVLLVVRPGFQRLEWGHLAMFCCVLSHAGSATLTRHISSSERRITLFIVPPIYAVLFNLMMVLVLGYQVPNIVELIMMIVCGILSGLGSVLYINALANSPVSRVEPMNYSQIVWAVLFGIFFFNEIVDHIAVLGMMVVVAGGIGAIYADGIRNRGAS